MDGAASEAGSSGLRWTVLVPMRALPAAKSRLAASAPGGLHQALVAAIREDTLAAVDAAAPAARIVVLADRAGDFGGQHLLVQSSPGLNGALADGARLARERWPGDGVAALVGDLPALQADELTAALEQATTLAAGYVPDAAGTGTTLLTAAPGHPLLPRFGAGSAARHARDAARLDAGPGLRHDVDTFADLLAAVPLGLGRRTASVLAGSGLLDRVDDRSS